MARIAQDVTGPSASTNGLDDPASVPINPLVMRGQGADNHNARVETSY